MHPVDRTLTAEQVRVMLNYEPSTGTLTWRQSGGRGVLPGDVAGTISVQGYRVVSVNDDRILAHRLVWLMHYGEWPSSNVSFKNGDRLDLRIDNLVIKSNSELARTRSGIKGVSESRHGTWRAEITRNYERIYLGSFKTEDEAVSAYKVAVDSDDPQSLRPKGKPYTLKSRTHYNLLRSAWKRTLAENNNITGWATFPAFAADLQDHVFPYCRIVPISKEFPVGPANFVAERMAKYDRKTKEGRIAYYKHKNKVRKAEIKSSSLTKTFGITIVQYNDMKDAQGGRCAICRKQETHKYKGTVRDLSVDHCHTTGDVRALLCHGCNLGLGGFRDNPEFMRAAADYIEHHRAKQNSVPASEHPPEKRGAQAS